MTKPTTEEFAELVGEIGEMMPEKLAINHLGSFIMTVAHAYIHADDVPFFLRTLADGCENDAEAIRELFADVAEES